MPFYTRTLDQLPQALHYMDSPPARLHICTQRPDTFDDLMARPRIAIVGSRKLTTYGQTVTQQLAGGLAARGVVIVSGLAIGVDVIAHRAALDANGLTIAVLPSPVDQPYPHSHRGIAERITATDGALISEYPPGTETFKGNFVARNRIVAAISNGLLITEAAEKSGTLHTARFAIDQGVQVFVVPGNITSPMSDGTNNLLKAGAAPVTNINDILQTLKLPDSTDTADQPTRIRGGNSQEQAIINLLEQGISDGSELLAASQLSINQFNHHLTMLEISAKIRPLGANRWALQ